MLTKHIKCFVALLLTAALAAIPLAACSNGGPKASPSGSQTASKNAERQEYQKVQFRDITLLVPDDLKADPYGTEDEMSFFLPESSKNPFAVSVHCFYNGATELDANTIYEGMKAGDDKVELVEANGIEFVVQSDIRDKTMTTSVMFVFNGSSYAVFADCNKGTDAAYEEFVDNLPKYINAESGSAPSSPSASSGAISWQEAQSHIGESITVYGPVVDTNYAAKVNGQPTYLNIGVPYPDKSGVSALIWGEDRGAFSAAPESVYKGKTVCVTGEPYMYNGQCYIKVTSPSQIQVL